MPTENPANPPDPNPSLNQPRSRADLFWSFTWLALQGFGGVLAVVQRELVEKKRWMTREQFVEDWAVAQIMPGPNVVNLSMMIGGRCLGLSGALAALAGMLATAGGGAACWPLFAGRGRHTAGPGRAARHGRGGGGPDHRHRPEADRRAGKNAMGWGACIALAAATFVAMAVLRWPLAWVLLGLGVLACLLGLGEAAAPAPRGRRLT
jgi:chromate transporter